MNVVMTLLVRDEEDIVAANIEYHLSMGVDFIIATDNNSIDRTAEILKEYEAKGRLKYIFEPEDNYNQHAWVTKMARMAFSDYSADWVINNDADEFWWPLNGNIKDSFSLVPQETNIIEAPRHNFVPIGDSNEPFWRTMIYREKVSLNPIGMPLPPKVAHRGSEQVIVHQGNHSVGGLGKIAAVKDVVEILHYPIRSYQQIENKIIKGGAAYERNTELPKSVGATWRALYEEYLKFGHLKQYFERTHYSKKLLEDCISTGHLVVDKRLAEYFRSVNAPN